MVKVPLPNSDLFITDIDFEKEMVSYQIRDKETGALLESKGVDKCEIEGDMVWFAKRFLPVNLFSTITEILKSE